MLQVGAEGHHVEDRLVGDIVTAGDLQSPQFGAALGNGVKPSVREPPAAADSDGFQHETHVGCVLAESAGQHLEGAVHVDGLARQADSPPEPRVPGQVVPAAAHARAAAQLVGGQEGEDLHHALVRQALDAGLLLLRAGGEPDERVGEAGRGRGVDHGHRLPGDGGRGGGRAPSILKSGQVRGTYQRGAGRAQCAHAQVGVWQRTESKGLKGAQGRGQRGTRSPRISLLDRPPAESVTGSRSTGECHPLQKEASLQEGWATSSVKGQIRNV